MISFHYWFPEPRRRWPALDVRGIGIREEMPPCSIRRAEGTEDFLFMLFHDEITIGDGPAAAVHPPGTMVLWRPGDPHFYGSTAKKWHHSWIHCDGPAVRKLVRSTGLPLRQPFVLRDPSRCDKYLFDLHEELSVRHSADGVIAVNVIENWLRDLRRQLSDDGRRAVPAEFVAVRTYLQSHSAESLSLAALADRVGLSVPHFCSKFKQLFGAPPIAYVLRLRLHLAASLLRDTTLSVKEVSRRVGYRDVYYFSRHFKRQFGISPKHLRMTPTKQLASRRGSPSGNFSK